MLNIECLGSIAKFGRDQRTLQLFSYRISKVRELSLSNIERLGSIGKFRQRSENLTDIFLEPEQKELVVFFIARSARYSMIA